MLSIYLSDDRIKIIDGQIKGKKFYIKKFAETLTDVGSIETGNIKDVLALTQAIQTLMNDNAIKPQKVVVVLDNSRIVFREQEVPALPEKKLKVILVSDLFSDAKSKNYVVDYVVDEKFKDEEKKNKYRIHVTYQTADAIASIAKGVNELNMKCMSIDVAQNSMSKLISDTAKLTGLNLLIDYENSFISLYVLDGNRRRFSKSSILYTKPPEAVSNVDSEAQEAPDWQYFVKEFQNNIISVCNFYEQKNAGTEIQNIYLTGNISVLNEDFVQQLANATKMQVSYLPCPDNIIGMDHIDFNNYSSTIGALIMRK